MDVTAMQVNMQVHPELTTMLLISSVYLFQPYTYVFSYVSLPTSGAVHPLL